VPLTQQSRELEAARKKGTGSFFLDILGAPLLKRPALSEAVAKYRKGLTDVDVRAGTMASKVPGLGKVFEEKMTTPVAHVGKFEITHSRPVHRLTAPLVKAQKFLVPIFAYEGLRRMMSRDGEEKGKEAGETMMTRDEQAVLMKAASVIEKLGKEREYLISELAKAVQEKEAHRLAREMAEKGLIAQEDLDKKAAELSTEEDLGVVKKAVSMTEKGFSMGKVEKTAGVEGQAEGEELDPLTAYLVDHINGRAR